MRWLDDTGNLWALGRATGQYIGAFPNGFLPRIQHDLGIDIYNSDVLFPFGGATPQRDNWVVNDIQNGDAVGPNGETLEVDTGFDARDLPEKWTNKFDVVISDPPYGKDYSLDLYDVEYATPKSHFSEATRVVKPGGYVLVLDQLVYNLEWAHEEHPIEREQVVGITTGPGMRIRALNVHYQHNRLDEYGKQS